MKLGLFLLLAMIVMSGAAPAAQNKDRGVAGTYDLLICKGECSFTEHRNVLRTAVIVLFDRAMRRNDIARIDSTYLDFRYDKAKACYLLDFPNRQASGVTAWMLDGHTLSFTLMHSPDSWYSVRVERTGDLLRGVGNIWSAGVAPPPDFIPDTVIGRRRGSADISVCTAKVAPLPK
jgi:hypothetical protein